MLKIFNFLHTAPHISKLPTQKIDARYKKLRWQIFIGVTIGYAGYYLVRDNFVLAMPHLLQQGFTKTQLGIIFSAFPIMYSLSKLFMATISDRSNPRYFMATGLALSTTLNFFLGTNLVLNNFILMLMLMFFNGLAQGMGWPSLVRVMTHWFSKNERGTKMSIISITQNFSRGIIGPLTFLGIFIFISWHSIFYFPAILSLIAMVAVLLLVKDSPQSEGLPSIEEYNCTDLNCRNTVPDANFEKELTTKEILFNYIFTNKKLWYLALANIFVYFVRYGIIDWAPVYLREVKGFSLNTSSWAYFLYEYAAIPGVFLCGWLSDKFFCSRRIPICIIYILSVSVVILFYWFIPAGNPIPITAALLSIGFFIYGPVFLIGAVQALDLVPKKAAGTAASFTDFFGHILGRTIANIGIGSAVDNFGWNIVFIMLLISCALAILCLMHIGSANSIK